MKRKVLFSVASSLLVFALVVATGCASAQTKVGDTIQLGTFEGKQLDWQVLAVENGAALVITKDVVGRHAYNDTSAEVTWENCTLRDYLNTTLYNNFSSDDQAKIKETQISNPDNSEYDTPGGNPTTDKVFLLSIDEANKYFASDTARVAKYNGGAVSWWLRSPGYGADSAATVSQSGGVYSIGYDVYGGGSGVRPALWLILDH